MAGDAAGVLAQVGARRTAAEAFDQIVTEYPITSGPYVIAQRRLGRGASSSSATPTTGRATWRAPRLLQLRPRRLPLLPGPRGRARGLQGRRVRHPQGVRRAQLGAPAQGPEVGRRAHREGPSSRSAVGQGLQSYHLNLRRPLFQDIRVREALGYTYDFETLNRLRQVQARQQPVQQLASSPPQGLPSPGELKLLEPFRGRAAAARVRPGVRRAAHRRRPERCARTC